MRKLPRGLLIAFEGIDGSGKTTQIKEVADRLQKMGFIVTVTHEPNHNSPYSQFIKEKVKKHRDKTTPEQELEWYTLDRKWDLEVNITPALRKNHLVLVDRYYLSSAAYQGALNEFSPEYILERNAFAHRPDLWLILDVPVPIGQSRIRVRDKKKNEDQLEIPTFQEKVRDNYDKLAKMDIGGEVIRIDASINEDKLTQELISIILKFIDKIVADI